MSFQPKPTMAEILRKQAHAAVDSALDDAKARVKTKAESAAMEGKFSCEIIISGEEITHKAKFISWLRTEWGVGVKEQEVVEGRVAIQVTW